MIFPRRILKLQTPIVNDFFASIIPLENTVNDTLLKT